jgi:hypothetical protein
MSKCLYKLNIRLNTYGDMQDTNGNMAMPPSHFLQKLALGDQEFLQMRDSFMTLVKNSINEYMETSKDYLELDSRAKTDHEAIIAKCAEIYNTHYKKDIENLILAQDFDMVI